MNKAETIVFNHFKATSHDIIKCNHRKPDFIVDNSFYVEVKNLDTTNSESRYLTRNQIKDFTAIFFTKCIPIYIYYIKDNYIHKTEVFTPIDTGKGRTKTINVTFEDKEFVHIDSVKPLGVSWRNFILTLTGYNKEVDKHETNTKRPSGSD